jgi:hypothetical protein
VWIKVGFVGYLGLVVVGEGCDCVGECEESDFCGVHNICVMLQFLYLALW